MRFFLPVVFSVFFFISNVFAFQFNVDPPKLTLDVKPGERKNAYIRVTNISAKDPAHIKVYFSDIIYLPDGSNDFVPVGSTPWSLKDWVKVNPNEFDIFPGEEKTVRFQVNVPIEARGGYYGVVFFEKYSSQPARKNQTALTIGVRIGTIVLVEAKGTAVYEAKIGALNIVKKENNHRIECLIQNSGNTLIRPFGTAQVLDAKNNIIRAIKINSNKEGIFPRTSRKFAADSAGPLKSGRYTVKVLLDYGGDALLGGQSFFDVKAKE